MNRTSPTTEPGYINRNNQKNLGPLGRQGNHPNQQAYELECLSEQGGCGTMYGANGADIHLRRCPAPDCQFGGGAPGC